MAFLAGQKLSAAALRAATTRLIARGQRITTSTGSTSTTDVPLLRIDDAPLTSGYAYRIVATAHLDSSVNADALRVRLRYTTDGSTPSTSSTILPYVVDTAQANAGIGETRVVMGLYTPASDETFSIIMSVSRASGTGSATVFADGASYTTDLYIESLGPDTGDVGVDL